MGRSTLIHDMLKILVKNTKVSEIIIILNAPDLDLPTHKKIKYIGDGVNMYVNRAWNLGVSMAKDSIILLNDDILIKDFSKVLKMIEKSDFDIIGIKRGELGISEIKDFPQNGYGCFLYVRDFVYIVENLKIWYGDKIQFDYAPKKGIISCDYEGKHSRTVNEFRGTVCKQDMEVFAKMNRTEKKLNLLIRTSGRPEYFKRMIKSINYDVKLHVICDTPESCEYVKKYCKDFEYKIYKIDRELSIKISRKKKIERAFFPYNDYFNSVLRLIDGWCMVLDDDDRLIELPTIKNDRSQFYVCRTQIGSRVVPSDKNFGKIVLNDISSISVIFHSSQFQKWNPQRGGDFDFISGLSKNYKPVFMDKIISKSDKGNFGQRNDLKKVSVNMATFPARFEQSTKVIKSLLKIALIDKIRVYLNEYESVPKQFPKSKKITYFCGGPDIKDSGKFWWAGTFKNEYYFTIDDDLIYPKEYFEKHLAELEKYNGKVFVTLHGKVMPENPKSFNDNTVNYHCLRPQEADAWVNNGGTGVMAFDNLKFAIPPIFDYHGMADLWVAYFCQKNKIPILCRKHEKELVYILEPDDFTLFKVRETLTENHKKILKKIGKMKLYKL